MSFNCVRRILRLRGFGLHSAPPLRMDAPHSAQDERMGKNMPYVVYILECADGSYYTGSAADLSQRLWQHETGALPSTTLVAASAPRSAQGEKQENYL